ncbi:MAG: hypothetical protein Q9164_003547 [Protoblastenia rupestris]
MCGTIQVALALSFQKTAIALGQDSGIITAAAHLYNAARKEGMMTAVWEDMEEFLSAWSPEKIFLGSTPEDRETYHRRYLLLAGIQKGESRGFWNAAQLTTLVFERLSSDEKRVSNIGKCMLQRICWIMQAFVKSDQKGLEEKNSSQHEDMLDEDEKETLSELSPATL